MSYEMVVLTRTGVLHAVQLLSHSEGEEDSGSEVQAVLALHQVSTHSVQELIEAQKVGGAGHEDIAVGCHNEECIALCKK